MLNSFDTFNFIIFLETYKISPFFFTIKKNVSVRVFFH